MDLPFALKIILAATCVAVFLGTVRVRPFVVGCLATIVPPLLFLTLFLSEKGSESVGNRFAAFVAFGFLPSAVGMAVAFQVGRVAASLGLRITGGRNQSRSEGEK